MGDDARARTQLLLAECETTDRLLSSQQQTFGARWGGGSLRASGFPLVKFGSVEGGNMVQVFSCT